MFTSCRVRDGTSTEVSTNVQVEESSAQADSTVGGAIGGVIVAILVVAVVGILVGLVVLVGHRKKRKTKAASALYGRGRSLVLNDACILTLALYIRRGNIASTKMIWEECQK